MEMDIWIINKEKGQIWDKIKQKRKMLQLKAFINGCLAPGKMEWD